MFYFYDYKRQSISVAENVLFFLLAGSELHPTIEQQKFMTYIKL